MANIRKRGAKWQATVRRNGLAAQIKSFIKRDDAVRWARAQESAIDRGELKVQKINSQEPLLSLLERYEREITVAKRSFASEICHIKQIKRHGLAAMTVTDITAPDIARFRDDRLKSVKGGTVRKELNILSHLFKIAAQEWGYALNSNPCQPVTKPRGSRSRERRLQDEELPLLLTALSQCRNPLIKSVFQFAVFTGMRRSEVLSLTWSNVDFEACTAVIEQTKNGERRTVPLSPDAIDTLKGRLAAEGDDAPLGQPIFPISANALRLAWERAKRRAGVKDFRFHDLRHEAISRFFEMGLSVPEVALISGHKDARMLFRYTHLKPEVVAKKLERAG